MLRLVAQIIKLSYLTLLAVQNRVSDSWKAALFVFYSQNPEIALSLSKAAEFYRDKLKTFFKILKNADTVLNFSYLAMKLPNFKTSERKTNRVETSSVS